MSGTQLRIRHSLDQDERSAVLKFGTEIDRLWNVPVAGQGHKRTLLKVEQQFDWSEAAPGKLPKFLGRTVTTPTDDALAALQRQLRIFILNHEPMKKILAT